MQQLEIQFFFPLTEQIPLDLDYTECDAIRWWSNLPLAGTVLTSNGVGGTTWATVPSTIQFRPSDETVGYWKVGEGFQMHNKKRPNWLHQKMTEVFFGWKWMDK